MSEYQDKTHILSFRDWEDELDDLVGGTLQLRVCGPQSRCRNFRGEITSIRFSANYQFILELENRRSFNPELGVWQRANQVERLLHPIETKHLGFIMGPFILADQTIFWTYGKEPYDPEQCVWIFPPGVKVPSEPFHDEVVAGMIGEFIEADSPLYMKFAEKEKPKRSK